MDPREALVALNMIEHVGPVRLRQLLEHFGDAVRVLQASAAELSQVPGIGAETATAIAQWEQTVDLAAELQRIRDYGCTVVVPADTAYPELLRQIYDPPIVLYVKGGLEPRTATRWPLLARAAPRPTGRSAPAVSGINWPIAA
ncbi:MAG: helix-hairpin-helix domain-containing protein [Verrucomicrobia bacterium]|nr:helix-hairpin-helix domain-containing protein [Verrucomicrobiota bacterium]